MCREANTVFFNFGGLNGGVFWEFYGGVNGGVFSRFGWGGISKSPSGHSENYPDAVAAG